MRRKYRLYIGCSMVCYVNMSVFMGRHGAPVFHNTVRIDRVTSVGSSQYIIVFQSLKYQYQKNVWKTNLFAAHMDKILYKTFDKMGNSRVNYVHINIIESIYSILIIYSIQLETTCPWKCVYFWTVLEDIYFVT